MIGGLEMSVQETGDCLRNPKRGHYLDLTITSADRADGYLTPLDSEPPTG